MEAGKRAVASAKAGTEKSKAALQAKAEKLTASHPAEKEAAEERKQERIREAEAAKREPGAEAEQPIAIATVTVRPSSAEHNPHTGVSSAGAGRGYT